MCFVRLRLLSLSLSLSLCRQHDLISLIVDKHQVVGSHGLNLYLGEQVEEANMLRPEEYGLSLADVKCPGGSINDHVLQVLTYDYQPHKTTDTGTIPPSRSYGIMQVRRPGGKGLGSAKLANFANF